MEKEIKKIIEKNPVALATTDEKGNPYCIAVADVKVIDNKLLIGDNYMKNTIENIKNNKNVCLVVWNKDLVGYQLKGSAEYFKEGKWLELVKKIHKGYPAKGAIVIDIKQIKKLSE